MPKNLLRKQRRRRPDAEVVGTAEEDVLTEGDWQYYIRDDGTVMIASYKGDAIDLVIPDIIAGCPVTSIGEYAFHWRHNLESVVLPDGLESVMAGAFQDCENLSRIEIPGSVTSVEEGAFYDCENLLDIEVSAQNTMYTVCEGLFI